MTTVLDEIRALCRGHANPVCQRVGCSNPSTWTPLILLAIIDGGDDSVVALGTTLGFCDSCRLYMIESALSKIVTDAETATINMGFPIDASRSRWEIVPLHTEVKNGK